MFNSWHAAFHGTRGDSVKAILECGDPLIPSASLRAQMQTPMADHHCLRTCFNAYVVVISDNFYFSIVFGYGSVANEFETKEK